MQTTTRLMLASAAVALFAATPAIAQTKVTAYLGGLTNESNYPGIVAAISPRSVHGPSAMTWPTSTR